MTRNKKIFFKFVSILALLFITIFSFIKNNSLKAENENYIYAKNINDTKLELRNSLGISGQWKKSDTYDGTYTDLGEAIKYEISDKTEASAGWYKMDDLEPIQVLVRHDDTYEGVSYDSIKFAGRTPGWNSDAHTWYIANNINNLAYSLYYDNNSDHINFSLMFKHTYALPNSGQDTVWLSTSNYRWEMYTSEGIVGALNEEDNPNYNSEYERGCYVDYVIPVPCDTGIKFSLKLGENQKTFAIKNMAAIGNDDYRTTFSDTRKATNPVIIAKRTYISTTNQPLKQLEVFLGDYDKNNGVDANLVTNAIKPAFSLSSKNKIDTLYLGEEEDLKLYSFNKDDNEASYIQGTFNSEFGVDVAFIGPNYGPYALDNGDTVESGFTVGWTNGYNPGDIIEFIINAGELQSLALHEHNFSYEANNNTITATCESGCPITDGLTLTLNGPSNTVFDNTNKTATLTAGFNTEAFANPEQKIKYYKGTTEVTSCKDVGTYTAKITYGNATAVKEFTITKADPSYIAPDSLNAIYGQTLSSVILPEHWTWKDSTAQVGTVGTHQHIAIYHLSDNYNDIEANVTVFVEKANPPIIIPPVIVNINTKLKDINLPAGWAFEGDLDEVLTTAGTVNKKATFTPEDTDNYKIKEHIDFPIQVTSHVHDFSYRADKNKIIASCNNQDCPIASGLTLEILAPSSNLIYDGTNKVATIKDGYDETVFVDPVIKHYKNNKEVTECKEAGVYEAKVTINNVTASLTFEIKKWELKDDITEGVNIKLNDVPFDSNVKLKVEAKNEINNKEALTKLLKDDEKVSKVYDISLIKVVNNENKVISLSEIKEGTVVTVSITLDSDTAKNLTNVVRYHDENDCEAIKNYHLEGNVLTFDINSLDEFAIVTKTLSAKTEPVESPKNDKLPGGAIACIVILIIVTILVCAYFIIFFLFNKWIIIDDKVVRAFKVRKKDDEITLYTFKFKKEIRIKEEVFKKKKDAEDYMSDDNYNLKNEKNDVKSDQDNLN